MLGFGLMLCGTAALHGPLHNWWGPLKDGVSCRWTTLDARGACVVRLDELVDTLP